MSRRAGWMALGALAGGTTAALAVLGIGRVLSSPADVAVPRFVEEASAAGIDHVYDGGFPYFVGGGVAVFDCDGDGFQDVYLAGGSNRAALYRNVSSEGGAIRFERVESDTTDLESVSGAYPIDVEGDGVADLAVLRVGSNTMLRGVGDCRFEPGDWNVPGGDSWTAAFSAKWEGALPTMAFGNYATLDETERKAVGCADNVLVRPDASGVGYGPPVTLAPGYCTLSVLFSDWDRSGRRDLRMTNDRHYYVDGEEQLWRVAPGEPPRLYGASDGWQPMQIWGMGIASQDLTGDGLPEVFLTSQGDNKLQTLAVGPAEPDYRDIALERSATAHRPFTGGDVMPSTAWHAEFQDVNNDGRMDLFVAKGNVDAMPEFAANDPSNLMLGMPDGTFHESAAEAGIVSFAKGRGAALADFNVDGLLDLIEVNRSSAVKLWRSVGAGDPDRPKQMGNWLSVRILDTGPNRDAIGSWIEVRAGEELVEREVTIGGGHAGGQLGWIHFGIGSEASAEIRVTWPDGVVGPWQPIDVNHFSRLERGAAPVTWEP